MTSVDGLKDLKNLQTLYLSNCTNLTSVDVLKDLKNLQTLYLPKDQFPTDVINELQKRLPQTQITYQ